MGRWGDGIYESDATLDFLATLTDRFEREIAYWMSPEHVIYKTHWLNTVLTVIELMLLFDKENRGSTVYINNEQAVKRWQNIFFSVWDADWTDDYRKTNKLSSPTYRAVNRHVIVKWFERLHTTAVYWWHLGTSQEKPPTLPDFNPQEPFPYFPPDLFVTKIVYELISTTVFNLSDENRPLAISGFGKIEEVWVCIDLIGLLCETYKLTSVSSETVDIWLNKMIRVWKEFIIEDDGDLSGLEEDPIYNNILSSFRRLKIVTDKYPLPTWLT